MASEDTKATYNSNHDFIGKRDPAIWGKSVRKNSSNFNGKSKGRESTTPIEDIHDSFYSFEGASGLQLK
ncbi:MAG: hypothetical protein K9G62_05815 [Alphaproteobacteria bacterium]|nr:hypothetical protein [Alphaproteobacteria bacterium]